MNFSQRFIFILALFFSFSWSAYAQTPNDSPAQSTLTQKLIAEDATQLVQQARESGNIIRGAILFHQGNINCARCHRPAAGKTRLGPDLSKLGKDMTDETIVESILEHSKVIAKGFATKVIRHFDCLLYTSPSPRDRQKSRMPSSA